MVPASVTVSKSPRESSTKTRCWSTLLGCPKGCPKGYFRNRTLGGLILSGCWSPWFTTTVLIPCSSKTRAISPPDWLHTFQVVPISTTSTPSATNRRATSGAVSLMSFSMSSRMIKPMNAYAVSAKEPMRPSAANSFIRS